MKTNLTISQHGQRAQANNQTYLILLGALAAASFAAPFMRLAQNNDLPSLLIAAGRLTLAALVYTPFVLYHYRSDIAQLTYRDLGFALLAGFWLAIHFVLLVLALEYTSILITQVIVNTGPIWVALLEVFFLKTRLPRIVWIGLSITLAGGLVIALSSTTGISTGADPALGNVLALAGSLAGSIYLTIGRSVRAKVSVVPYVWIVFGFGALTALTIVALTGTSVVGHPPEGYFWLLMVTLFAQLAAHSGINFVLGYIPATIVSLSSQVLSVTAPLLAVFLFAEYPTGFEIVGSLIILVGVSLAITAQGQKRKPSGAEV